MCQVCYLEQILFATCLWFHFTYKTNCLHKCNGAVPSFLDVSVYISSH